MVLVAQRLEQLDSAIAVVERNGHINTSEVCDVRDIIGLSSYLPWVYDKHTLYT